MAYSDQVPSDSILYTVINCLGYIQIVQAASTTLVCYLMARNSVLIMLTTATALVLTLTGASSILFTNICSGSLGQTSDSVSHRIGVKYLKSDAAQKCLNSLMEGKMNQPIELCETELLQGALAPAKHLMIWCINAIFSVIFTVVMLYRHAKFFKRISRLFKVGLVDVGMTVLFVIAFISGYAYLSRVEAGTAQMVTFNSRVKPGIKPEFAHNQYSSSQTVSSWSVSTSQGAIQQLVSTTTVSTETMPDGSIVFKKVIEQVANGATIVFLLSEEQTTYPNKTIITYVNTTKREKDVSIPKTIHQVTIQNPDGSSNTYSLDEMPKKRRILMEAHENHLLKGSHMQGSTGGNFIWISCFTGFGPASLIRINTITDNLPTMESCDKRLASERPNYTLSKLRQRYSQYITENPGFA